MARPRKPWFRKQTKCWYVEIDGKQHNLGNDKENALREYHKLMAEGPKAPSPDQLVVILDKFLEWTQAHRPASYRWYKDYLTSFDETYPDLRVDDLRVHHVEEWASKGKGSAVTRRFASPKGPPSIERAAWRAKRTSCAVTR
jgi:hypothetical protein